FKISAVVVFTSLFCSPYFKQFCYGVRVRNSEVGHNQIRWVLFGEISLLITVSKIKSLKLER
ncbi:unnamed protein product, partial [Allacma fusca]